MSEEEYFKRHADPKFPGQGQTGLPPFPSAENPGSVFPRTDPNIPVPQPNSAASLPSNRFVGNPFLMLDALNNVDHAFGEVIALLEQEERAQDRHAGGDALLQRFRSWRKELADIKSGRVNVPFPNKYGGVSASTHVEGIFKD